MKSMVKKLKGEINKLVKWLDIRQQRNKKDDQNIEKAEKAIVLVAVFITEDTIIHTTNPVLTFSILEDTEETRKQIRT